MIWLNSKDIFDIFLFTTKLVYTYSSAWRKGPVSGFVGDIPHASANVGQ